MFFHYQIGPCPPRDVVVTGEFGLPVLVEIPLMFSRDWPIYFLYMFTISALLAASLIDAELFIIPLEIPWLMAIVGIVVHTLVDDQTLPGALNINPPAAAMSLGAGIGLAISLLLLRAGVLKRSFPRGEPLLEIDRQMLAAEAEQARREGRAVEQPELPPSYTKNQIRWEMRHEALFLTPPMVLGAVLVVVTMMPSLRQPWEAFSTGPYAGGFFGALMGALTGGAIVWVTRILGTLGFGRVAMGLGDVHLMLGVGAVLGAGAVTVAFFLAPFFGILFALYKLITRTGRELPYGPFLGMASALVMLFYCPIAHWLKPGLQGLGLFVRQAVGE
jgi:leader peptidase (prepilin peptidase)/N-methyltransferase